MTLFFIKIQHIVGYIYIPMFKFALYILAPFYVIFSPRSKNARLEVPQLLVHYFWYGYYLMQIQCVYYRIIYFFLSNIFASVVFLQIVLAHLAMPIGFNSDQEEYALH